MKHRLNTMSKNGGFPLIHIHSKRNTINAKKINAAMRNIALAAIFIAASKAVNAADVGAQVGVHVIEYDAYGNPINTGYGCDTGLQIPNASCDGGGSYGSGIADMRTAGMAVHASSSGAIESDALANIHDTLFLSGNIPSDAHAVFSAYGSGSVSGDASAQIGLSVSFPLSAIDNGLVVTGFGSPTYPQGCSHPYFVPDATVCVSGYSVSLDLPLSYMDPTYRGLNINLGISCGANLSRSGGSGTCDFTDPLTITLPDGVTYTSASGQFLTAPVPVPAAAWLFGSGLLGLIGVARRKKTA